MNREIIERIKDIVRIEDIIGQSVSLKRKGANLGGLCPFHTEKTPSFTVFPSRQTYKCFGCGKGGDVFNYVMESNGIDFMDAVRKLAEANNIEIAPSTKEEVIKFERRTVLITAITSAQRAFEADKEKAFTYWKGRGFSEDTLVKFGVGYINGNTINKLQIEPDLKRAVGLLNADNKPFSLTVIRYRLPIPKGISSVLRAAPLAMKSQNTCIPAIQSCLTNRKYYLI